MSEASPRRQHPVAAISQVLDIIKGNIIPILFLMLVGSGDGSAFQFMGILPILLLLLAAGVLSWWRFTYQIVNGELHIKRGVFFRKNIYLSPERIQVIDITTGIVQRIFGLVAVEVKTAGSSSKAARIDAITRAEAEWLRDTLRKGKPEANTEGDAEAAAPRIYTLGMKDLLIAASTSGNLAVTLSIVAGAMSQLDQFLTEERVAYFLESAVPGSMGVNLIVSLVILGLAISWVLSFLGTFIKHYGFTLRVDEEELHLESGLFERKQLTIPFNRIQAVRIKEELLRQPFGYAAVFLESAGYGDERNSATTLFPLLASRETAAFLQEVIPEYNVSVEGVRPPGKALRRYLLRMTWVSLAIILPVWLLVPYGVYAWLLLIPALMLGYFQYKDAMIGVANKTMVIRSRGLSKTTAIIKKHRVQAIEISQNPFQRRLKLCTYSATVASGNRGRTFLIRELDEPGALRFFNWVSPVGER